MNESFTRRGLSSIDLSALISRTEEVLEGAEAYREWCADLLKTTLTGLEVLGFGALVVPQGGTGSGSPTSLTSQLASGIDASTVHSMVSAAWKSSAVETSAVKLSGQRDDDSVSLITAPVSMWFRPPIGIMWAVAPTAHTEEVRPFLIHAAHLTSLAVRAAKSARSLDLLSKPIWPEQTSTVEKATQAAESCLLALGCKAAVVWIIDRTRQPATLATLAAVGNVAQDLSFDMQLGVGAAGVVALNNQVVVIDDLLDTEELARHGISGIRHQGVVRRLQWRSAIMVPLDIGGQTAGVFSVYGERVRAFSGPDQNTVLAFAQRLAAGYTHAARISELTEMERRIALEAAAIETGILAVEHVHDAHNSLGIAQAYAGLIKDRFSHTPESNVYKHAQAVSRNVDDALRLTKILRDGANISKVSISTNPLHKTLDSAIAQVQEPADRAKVRIHHNCPDSLKFDYDKRQILRVCKNFLDNSIFFLGDLHRRSAQIKIDVKVHDEIVEITFWDNGPGISEQDLPRVFDYFFTRKGEPRGMGFGLAIAKRIVERNHRGAIAVRSRWGDETEFVVSLPRKHRPRT